ncbi:MAG: AEC family transporter, partial [Clostridiales bacterium]|nr:AEC family transporter [Clostridiales bacterium]
MIQLYYALFQIIVCGVLGFVLRKSRVIDERTEKSLTEILLQAVLPFSIIASSQFTYSMELVEGMADVAMASAIYYSLSLLIISLILRKTKINPDEKRVMRTAMIFANTGFMGLPLMEALFGQSALLLGSIYNIMYNVFFYT